MHCSTSYIQSSCDGEACFHLRTMAHQANMVVKTMTPGIVDDTTEAEGMPNRAIKALGAIMVLRACGSVPKNVQPVAY